MGLKESKRYLCAAAACAALVAFSGGAQAQSYRTFYRFKGGSDGAKPVAPLATDGAGNLYGMTELGGANGIGTVFRLGADKSETILHSFAGQTADGAGPSGGVTMDSAGNLYGVTVNWGYQLGGTLFKIAPDGSESVLYSFGMPGSIDGSYPGTKPLVGADGNLYGTTPYGGSSGCSLGCGVIYRVRSTGSEDVLYTFQGHQFGDGGVPFGEPVADDAGNLYGTTTQGGSADGGIVYKLAPNGSMNGTLTTLYAFGADGKRKDGISAPAYGLVRDAAGNLYGVATVSARGKNCPNRNCGAIFELTSASELRVLHAFGGGADGAVPNSTMVMDAAGSLYGTTQAGGNSECANHQGCGTVFRYSPDGSMAILHAFNDREGTPNGLTLTAGGTLYGAAFHTGRTPRPA